MNEFGDIGLWFLEMEDVLHILITWVIGYTWTFFHSSVIAKGWIIFQAVTALVLIIKWPVPQHPSQAEFLPSQYGSSPPNMGAQHLAMRPKLSCSGPPPLYAKEDTLRKLEQAVETMQLGVTITDVHGKILYTNPAEAHMHGYRVDDLIGQDLGIFAPTELRKPMSLDQIKSLNSLRESVNIRKDGSLFVVRLRSNVLRDRTGDPLAIVTTCEDITAHKRSEEALKRYMRELRLVNTMNERLQACHSEEETYGVVTQTCQEMFQGHGGCLYVADRENGHMQLADFWGKPLHHASQCAPPMAAQAVQNDCVLPFIPRCPFNLSSQHADCLCEPIVASDTFLGMLSLCFEQPQPYHIADYRAQKTRAKRATLRRIVEHYSLALLNLRLRDSLKMESLRDPLTGLYNRRYMEESLVREAHRARRRNASLGIAMIDIDHFKHFNDQYGHEAGDAVLRTLGKCLQQCIRKEDIACRYGGEEFLLIFPETPLEVVLQRTQELRRQVGALQVNYQGTELHITISAGVAVLPEHGTEVLNVVNAADTALYQAKHNGRNQVVVASYSHPPSVVSNAQECKL